MYDVTVTWNDGHSFTFENVEHYEEKQSQLYLTGGSVIEVHVPLQDNSGFLVRHWTVRERSAGREKAVASLTG